MATINDKFIESFHSLSQDGKNKFINSLTVTEKEALYLYPELFLFPKQIITGTDWRYQLLICGRSFGKSYANSAWIHRKVLDGARNVGVCVPTYGDLLGVMIPMIKQWSPPNKQPVYNDKQHTLTYPNGAIIWCYSSDVELRGPNLEYLACDEIAKWNESIPEKVKERFEVMDYAVRAGDNPQIVITTTPKNFPIIKEWMEAAKTSPLYKITTGTVFDNDFITPKFKQAMLDKYGNTRLGRQELFGELLEDIEGALWSSKLIDDHRITPLEFKEKNIKLENVEVGVDPAVTNNTGSDETGIVAAGTYKGHAYVLEDASGSYTPNQWALKTFEMVQKYNATKIVAEKNNGGLLVETNLRTVSKNTTIKLVSATQGKIKRAEPICAIMQQGKIHHIGIHKKLEYQMTSYNGTSKSCAHDDRLDAYVWVLTDLMINPIYTNRHVDNIGFY